MPDQPNFQFPRWFPMRGGSGGHYGGNAASAISAFGDDISSVLAGFAQRAQQKKQDELANSLMNNGQSPGAAPYVRRAEYPDGDQGDDPGPVPFDSTDTPYTGGQQMAGMLAASAAAQQKAQQQQLAQSMAQRGQGLRSRQLDLEERGLNIKAAGKGPKTSKLLPPSLGDDNLPTNDPAMPAPTGAAPQSSGVMQFLGNLFNKTMGALPSGDSAGAPPDASPSATPLVAGGGIQQVKSIEEASKLPPGTKFRDPNGKIRTVPGG